MSLWGINDSVWKPLEDARWASVPTAQQALRALQPGSGEREQLAKQLALQGYTIDVPIDVWGWVVWAVMTERQNFGYTWVPSALQPPLATTPGNDLPGLPPYDPANPPAGSIRVSTNLGDYPPYLVPVPLPPVPGNQPFVGAHEFDNVYTYGPGSKGPNGFTVQNGQQVSQGGATYTAHRATGLMGESLYFTSNA